MPASTDKSPDTLLAENRLKEAIATSADIAEKIDKLRVIHAKIDGELGRLDLEWERRKFFTTHQDQIFAWASGNGKFPSTKELDALESNYRVMLFALDHVGMRLFALSSAAKMSQSEELVNRARILQIESQGANMQAARALSTIKGVIGLDAMIVVEGGKSEELQRGADELIEQASALRAEAERDVRKLQELTKGTDQNGR